MTATPIEQEYVLEELKHLPVCEIDWPHLMEVNIRSRQTSKPAQYIVKECRKVLDNQLPHNLAYLRKQRGVYRKGNRPCKTHSRTG